MTGGAVRALAPSRGDRGRAAADARGAGAGDRCGPGAAARAVAARLVSGHVVAVDRSARAVAQAEAGSAREIASGRMSVRCVAAEDFVRVPGEGPFDLVFAVRVGALDGRHPEAGRRVLERVAVALAPGGRLFVDGVDGVDRGDPLREISVPPGPPAEPGG
ncbi:SAM-dependent methyltransferase [Streptomyces sp. NPDC057148]|uniref:SAM-dependent methyltransferase n=1 Tax=unclassified Streptomyces TaxID=2593676 RepID=UPI00362E4532